MVLEKREEVKKIFEDFLDDSLLRIILSNPAFKDGAGPVSYTHLDVYKRQA